MPNGRGGVATPFVPLSDVGGDDGPWLASPLGCVVLRGLSLRVLTLQCRRVALFLLLVLSRFDVCLVGGRYKGTPLALVWAILNIPRLSPFGHGWHCILAVLSILRFKRRVLVG